MSIYERTVHVLAAQPGASEWARQLSNAGYMAAVHSDAESAQERMPRSQKDGVWLVRFDAEGRALMRWAQAHAPRTRVIALLERPRGAEVHDAYQLGAVFCTSTEDADVLRAVEMSTQGLDLAGQSGVRLRSIQAPDGERVERHTGVVTLPAPQIA